MFRKEFRDYLDSLHPEVRWTLLILLGRKEEKVIDEMIERGEPVPDQRCGGSVLLR